ncbi:hypothetical protein ACFE04_016119 [Oxalis oulophora]
MYKSKLQEVCQEKRWGLPKFTSMKDGPEHNPRFKATVTVNRISFDSHSPCKSSKDAQNDAAKLAFFHFTSPSSSSSTSSLPITNTSSAADQGLNTNIIINDSDSSCVVGDVELYDYEECPGFYKNLLQEFIQRQHFHLPVYKTLNSGASHMPMFVSSVEVEGETFRGKAGRSKKEAEQKAAKVALTALKERAQCRNSDSTPDNPAPDDIPKSTLRTEFPNHTVASEGESVQVEKSSEIPPSNAKTYPEDSLSSIISSQGDETTGKQNMFFQSLFTPNSPKEGIEQSQTTTLPDVSTLSISSSHTGKAKEASSYLLCNKVRVYPYLPDIAFPDGITVLPISEDRWIAVCLEFPNEKGS